MFLDIIVPSTKVIDIGVEEVGKKVNFQVLIIAVLFVVLALILGFLLMKKQKN